MIYTLFLCFPFCKIVVSPKFYPFVVLGLISVGPEVFIRREAQGDLFGKNLLPHKFLNGIKEV